MPFVVSLVASFVYLLMVNSVPSLQRTVAKGLVFGVMLVIPAIYAFVVPEAVTLNTLFFTLGLLGCVVGDIYLSLPETPARFTKGLASFLFGHVFYMAFMWPHIDLETGLRIEQAIFGGALMVSALGVMAVLWPRLGDMRLPVTVYMVVILSMTFMAGLVPESGTIIAAGATLFVISDALIALNKFRAPIPFAGPLIWITYYLGHSAMIFGFLFPLGLMQD